MENGSATTDDLVVVTQAGALAIVTLNRPKVLNALNGALLADLHAALLKLDANAAVRAIILTGSGDRAFAAGADIGELRALGGAFEAARAMERGQLLTLTIERLSKPVIAAINGFALGGGCEIAMACDIRIASEGAKFGQPEVNLGLMPGYGGTQRTTRLLGRGMAMLLCLTGELIDAAEALRIGLVQKVVPQAQLLDEARRIGSLIAAKSPLSITATKRAIDDGAALSIDQALKVEALHFATLVGTADFKEGTSAFLEKRAAVFTGK